MSLPNISWSPPFLPVPLKCLLTNQGSASVNGSDSQVACFNQQWLVQVVISYVLKTNNKSSLGCDC